MVTMIGLKPRREINPLSRPTIGPITRPTTRASQTGVPLIISQPVRQLDRAATPGIDRSSVPQMIPTATPAAKIALIAAALAMRIALFQLAKYGLHQTLNATISSPHRTKMPRSRRKIRPRTPALSAPAPVRPGGAEAAGRGGPRARRGPPDRAPRAGRLIVTLLSCDVRSAVRP